MLRSDGRYGLCDRDGQTQVLTDNFDLTPGGVVHEPIKTSNSGHLGFMKLTDVGFDSAELAHCLSLAQRGYLGYLITVDDEVNPSRLAMIDFACHQKILEERSLFSERISLVK